MKNKQRASFQEQSTAEQGNPVVGLGVDSKWIFESLKHGGSSSIEKLPEDMPPGRVYFFGLLVWPRV